MNAIYRKAPSSALAAAIALTTALPGSIQAAETRTAIEEVVVTATRVAGRIEDTPAAISAVQGDAIGTGGVSDIRDLQYEIPNLSVGQQFGVNRTFIRGIGLTSVELCADGAVAFHQDGAIIARPAAQLGTFHDIERVEVLRGPQGTLYGRGATAGAIDVITRKPSLETQGNLAVSAGEHGLFAAEGGVGGPVAGSEQVLYRVAGKFERRDGYGDNLATGTDINDRDYRALRGTLQWLPSEALTATLTYDWFKEDDRNYAFSFFGPTTVDPLGGQLLGGQTIFDVDPNPDPFDINADVDPENDRRGHSFVGALNWSEGAWNVDSITAYRDFKRRNVADLDSTDFDAFGRITYREESESFSQEVLVTWQDESTTILGGAMYFQEDLFGSTLVPLNNIELIIPGAPADGVFDQRGDIDIEAWGVFLQGTQQLTDRLSATAGVRYSKEKRDHTGSFTFTALGIIEVPTDNSDSWSSWTPKFTLDYRLGESTLVYGNIERGFKSGVINIGAINPPVDPETVWSYEIGVKTALLDERVSLAAAAFWYDYQDLQVGRIDETSTPITENAAEARNRGLELEMTAFLSDRVTFDLQASYLDAEFKEFNTFEPNRAAEGFKDLSGNRLPNAPKYSISAGLDYSQPLDMGGTLDIGVRVSWIDEVFFTEFNNEDAFQSDHTMVHARARYTAPTERWYAEYWVRNLTDTTVKANNIVAAQLFSFPRVGSLHPPRSMGVTFSLKF